MQPEADHAEMKLLLKRQMELLEENNRLLRKLNRRAIWGFWFRLLFYGLFLGLPILFYWYVVQPYVLEFDRSYRQTMERFENVPSFDVINALMRQTE